MQLGFIGLGALGTAVATRLMERQHTLTIWNRTQSRAEKLGVSVATSPKILAEGVEVIFLCLFDSAAVRQVLEDFSPHFSNALIYKDLHCLQDLAYDLKQPLHTAAVTKELYARTYQEGFENEDFSAIYKLFKSRSEG